MAAGGLYQNKLIHFKSRPLTQGHQEMSCHRDGGGSQGGTRHSMPPARRRAALTSTITKFLHREVMAAHGL